MAEIELTAADGHPFTAHRADPDGTPLGGVVVVQEIFGVNEHIRSVVDRFAAAGFVAVAPALFDRVERGIELAYDADGTARGRAIAWEQLEVDTPLLDLTATTQRLGAELGVAHVGAVGFCYGGMLAAALASRHPEQVSAAVAYYPSQAAQRLVDDQVERPLLIHLGNEDQGVTPADGDTLAARWPAAEVHRYDGAGHGFNCDLRPGFHAEASALAWDRTIAFLTRELAG